MLLAPGQMCNEKAGQTVGHDVVGNRIEDTHMGLDGWFKKRVTSWAVHVLFWASSGSAKE